MARRSGFKNNGAVMRKGRKATAIHAPGSIPLRPNQPECRTSSSRRRKRSASSNESEEVARREGSCRDGEEVGEVEAGADNQQHPTSTLLSFSKVLHPGALHTATCCRLILPRKFCERYNAQSEDVTMVDATVHRLWHMRFQSPCRSSSGSYNLVIGNGWREFAYDHSLKASDRLVFTLLSNSQFRVEFATSNGSTRAMLPTRDEQDPYPWRINYARLRCLSHANDVEFSQVWQQATQKKVIQKNVASITLEEEKLQPLSEGQREAPINPPKEILFCQCDTTKVGKGMNTRIDKSKEVVLPELTHLECKNPDGSSYLHILDSDSE